MTMEEKLDEILKECERGVGKPLGKIEGEKIGGIPIGPVVVGTMMGVFLSELTDRLLPVPWWVRWFRRILSYCPKRIRFAILNWCILNRYTRRGGIVKLAVAGVASKIFPDYNSQTVKAASLILACDALNNITPSFSDSLKKWSKKSQKGNHG